MCRICLVANVSILVVNKNLHEIYEKLTDNPFVTEDKRPMLTCSFCCTKLEQCYRLLRQCLEAESLFVQMINEDYEPKPVINQDHLELFSEFIISPTEKISIVDVVQTESIAVKEELPAVCEGLDDIIEPTEEHQSDELEPEIFDNSCLDVADVPPHYSESDLEEDHLPLMEFKTVEEEQKVFKKKGRARETKRAIVLEKPKLDTRRIKPKDAAEKTKTEKSDYYFKEPYKCEQRSFNTVKEMMQHARTHTGEKHYKCDVCQRSYSGKNALTKHKRIHTGHKPYKCDLCQCHFIQKCTLISHIRIHTGEKPYKCDVCQRSFRAKGTLRKHKLIHTGDKPYKCDVCQSSFRQNSALKEHIRIHTGKKLYKCDICQRNLSRKGGFTRHMRIHTSEKPYKCDVCQRSFREKGTLRKHKLIHTGDKPYKCDVCQSSFRQNSALKEHIRIHTGKKLYKCDICQRNLSRKGGFTRHMRIHTSEKPYKCDVCQRSFSRKGSLNRHILIHTGKKPNMVQLGQKVVKIMVVPVSCLL